MDRSEYLALLRETSEKVYPLMWKQVEGIRQIDAELYDAVMFLVSRKLAKPSLKATLFRLSYEACGGEDWENTIPGAAAFEFLNISSYQANAAFDTKLGVLSRSEKDSQFMAAMITREIAFHAASRLGERWGEQIAVEVQAALSKSNRCIYVAQHYDLNLLNVRNLERYREELLFNQHYVERCRYGSGVFTAECARMGGLLAGAHADWLSALGGFGEEFGTALQMVNDIGDFVPPDRGLKVARDFQELGSDVRNGRLTAPLYYLLNSSTSCLVEEVTHLAEAQTLSPEQITQVVALAPRTSAFARAKKMAKSHLRRAKASLHELPPSHARDLLAVMASQVRSNKYFGTLRSGLSDVQPDMESQCQANKR